jgi:hypothetical protein
MSAETGLHVEAAFLTVAYVLPAGSCSRAWPPGPPLLA